MNKSIETRLRRLEGPTQDGPVIIHTHSGPITFDSKQAVQRMLARVAKHGGRIYELHDE